MVALFDNSDGALLPGAVARVKIHSDREAYAFRAGRIFWRWLRTLGSSDAINALAQELTLIEYAGLLAQCWRHWLTRQPTASRAHTPVGASTIETTSARMMILGAVLGLIQVMQHLDNIQEVGRGIAVAFVATIYGVGIANLFFLPLAGKMRIRIREDCQRREMMLEGVISILEGMNPRMLEVKLSGFLDRPLENKQERAA